MRGCVASPFRSPLTLFPAVGLIVFGVTLGTELTSLYGILLGLSFIFSATCSNAFDSVIFLFVTHPFDTGDRVFIGTENLIVKKMGIFSTNFTRADGTEAYCELCVIS